MKMKEGFLLRRIAGQNIVLPAEGDMDLNMMITLNETGAFLWEHLQEQTDAEALVAALLKEYDVTPERAAAAVSGFLAKLREQHFLEE